VLEHREGYDAYDATAGHSCPGGGNWKGEAFVALEAEGNESLCSAEYQKGCFRIGIREYEKAKTSKRTSGLDDTYTTQFAKRLEDRTAGKAPQIMRPRRGIWAQEGKGIRFRGRKGETADPTNFTEKRRLPN